MNGVLKQLLKTLGLLVPFLMISILHAQNLDDYRWKKRIVIVQTSDETNIDYQTQLNEFIGKDKAFKERKLIVFNVVNKRYKLTEYPNHKNVVSWKNVTGSLEKYSGKGYNFKVSLIGLDGGTKLGQTSVIKSDDLFRIIDSMPMRSAEIKNKG